MRTLGRIYRIGGDWLCRDDLPILLILSILSKNLPICVHPRSSAAKIPFCVPSVYSVSLCVKDPQGASAMRSTLPGCLSLLVLGLLAQPIAAPPATAEEGQKLVVPSSRTGNGELLLIR